MAAIKTRIEKLEAQLGEGDHAPRQVATVIAGRQSEAEIEKFVKADGYSGDRLLIVSIIGREHDGLPVHQPLQWAWPKHG
jgi:hypothetical protein